MRDLQDQRDSTRHSISALDKIATRSGANHLPRRLAQLALALMLTGGCAVEGEFDPLVALHMRSEARAHLDLDEEGADLRPEAKYILEALHLGGWRAARELDRSPTGIKTFSGMPLPQTIRVWRRSKCSTGSCSCPVDVLPLEDYVKGVVPHEWISSWDSKSLQAGAIAVRTYASSWVAKGGKYDCADLCDTTRSQVYKDERNAAGNAAVDATRGMVVVEGGQLVFAEYSAENSDPTKFGVNDPPCAGKKLFGHGRGMCQWGSQRWATQGKDPTWIAMHYYPGSTVQGGSVGPVPCVPTGPEICDGRDNNCDGRVDEGCTGGCIPTGPEICDGRDNNCDGRVDEGCTGGCMPTGPEICDGRDNDCNGYVDETNPSGGAFCIVPGAQGHCASGMTRCIAGQIRCEATMQPRPEICNNVDDDCDGVVDNVPGGCAPECVPRPEICNGKDDDCNGIIDEGNPEGDRACHPGAGTCPAGLTSCDQGVIVCRPHRQMELCDGLDNDCNGVIDDPPAGCGPDAPSQCTSNPERCNGLDDDCDGIADEGNPEGGAACTIYTAANAFAGEMTCLAGQLVCQAKDLGAGGNDGAGRELSGMGCSYSAEGSSPLVGISTLLLLALIGWRRTQCVKTGGKE